MLSAIMKELESIVSRSVYLHCIGDSLGAHVCGFLGKGLQADPDTRQLDRISGLDPAGALFTNDIPYPFNNLNLTSGSRLNQTDAQFVDVIHTDGKPRFLNSLIQYGTMERIGQVAFYPGIDGYYGYDQPGCFSLLDVTACSHRRARLIYEHSIGASSHCTATKRCTSNPDHLPKNCYPLSQNDQIGLVMGYWLDPATRPGLYVVDTPMSEPPFCYD